MHHNRYKMQRITTNKKVNHSMVTSVSINNKNKLYSCQNAVPESIPLEDQSFRRNWSRRFFVVFLLRNCLFSYTMTSNFKTLYRHGRISWDRPTVLLFQLRNVNWLPWYTSKRVFSIVKCSEIKNVNNLSKWLESCLIRIQLTLLPSISYFCFTLITGNPFFMQKYERSWVLFDRTDKIIQKFRNRKLRYRARVGETYHPIRAHLLRHFYC
jgi:hypothetical protein